MRLYENQGLCARISKATILLAAVAGVVVVSGCASMGFHYDEGSLRKQVAFDTQCPPEKIKVIDAMEAGIGVTKFRLDVCGQEQKWNRMGTTYFAEGKGPMATK
jgi:hypothetical protein